MPFLGFGILIALVLNTGYFVGGQPDAIAFFVGIYDVFDNIGLDRTEGAPALLLSIWLSAPLGIAIAEYFRTRSAPASIADERNVLVAS